MKVIIADQAGFCFGVKRALDLVESQIGAQEKIATLGPLIHNPQIVKSLERKGVKIVSSLKDAEKGAIVLPSHGVSQSTKDEAKELGLIPIDATCPFVDKVHKKVQDLSKNGYFVVVIGDSGHSEVKAIMSAAGENAIVINSIEEAEKFDFKGKKVGIVSQTTQTPERFAEVIGAIAKQASEILAYNTICYATYDRQTAASDLSKRVDLMIIVGGKNSANTNRLAEICQKTGKPVYHIETSDELQKEWFNGVESVGITAGASTPDWIIEDVKNAIERLSQ
ncbi:MAG: 4-hydroxy-3-methylbut-2-enyl diphosphate reductase [Armatimonadota bacterium]